MTDPAQILKTARSILLVDWPHTGVPRALLGAGFTVFGFSPGCYSAASVVPKAPVDVDSRSVFAPQREGETGFLVFRKLDGPPANVDIVHIYRPAEEHPDIIARHVVPLGAMAIWLQPPITSAVTRRMATERGIAFVEGTDIVELADSVGPAGAA